MRSVKFLIAAGAVTLSTAAFAADLPIAAPPMYAPPPPAEFGGWYMRGDIGMTNQRIKSLTNTDPNAAASPRPVSASTPRCCGTSASAISSTTGSVAT